jgi:hypothetical protein
VLEECRKKSRRGEKSTARRILLWRGEKNRRMEKQWIHK